MLNATISHELRNPLNSIKARNMEKKYIYQNIKDLLNDKKIEESKLKSEIFNQVTKL